MKRLATSLFILAILALVLSACGLPPSATPAPLTPIPLDQATQVPAVESTAQAAPTVEATSQPSATSAPADTPAVSQGSGYPVTLVDGLGRSVILDKAPQRIVSMAPSNTEILFALGGSSQVIGRDDLSDYPTSAKSLPSIGGNMGKYNLEAVTGLQPDLVLAAGINTPDQVKALENLKIAVFYVPNPTDLAGLYKNLADVSQLIGRSTEGSQLIDSLKKRETAVKDAVGKATGQPAVFYELDGSNPAKPWTAGNGTFITLLINLAGGQNMAGDLKGGYAEYSLEDLIVKNPDFILLGDANYGVTVDSVKARAGWDVLKAVKDGKVIAVDDNLFSRPGPRMIDGLELLARTFHPDLVK